jgi:hypothetical protein
MRTLTITGCLLCALQGSAAAQIGFDPATSIPTGTLPEASALADFNGDGYFDLAVTSDNPDKVEVRLGSRVGGFGAAVSVPTGAGTGPHTPVTGDLDGDLDVDIAVSLKNVDRVRILVNDGGGAFTLGASLAVGAEPRSMAIGNLDGDADLDLAVSNRSGDSVSVLLNTGGSFAVTSYPTPAEPRELDIADLSGDGIADIAVAAHDTRQVIVLKNLGSGTFVNGPVLSVGANLRPQGLAVGDLDGDLLADIVASTQQGPGIEFATVFLNLGATAFGGAVSYPLDGIDAASLTAADFDLDGDLDLATANIDSNDINVLAGDGTGAFGTAQVLAAGIAPGHVLAGTIDKGSSPDLLVTNTGSDTVSIFLNQLAGYEFYCTAGTSASGCTAAIGATGIPSASAPSGFALSATDVEGSKDGLFFFGSNGRQANSWGNGTSFQCVVPPVKRAGQLTGVGTNGACDGAFAQDLNAYWCPTCPAAHKNPGAGTTVQAQLWYRDPLNPSNQTTSLSSAIEFVLAP